ncbi:hypothetical protein [Rahnella sp. ChDrAdgB13]|uniref:hypothetical protein n=1 Tax=Rahnella sp. ChDrAdgB13 TaxID=1850581 RepID=UPI001AD87AC9|nr:hypothetical protein [Rahnella sp. ChDrAdgB13]
MKDDHKIVALGKRQNSLEDELLNIAKMISNESPSLIEGEGQPSATSNHINGSGNIVGNGNFVNNGPIHINGSIRNKVYVRTGEGVVDASQKKAIKSLLYEWVGMEEAIKKSPLSYQKAWAMLNGFMDVNSYHEIKKQTLTKPLSI